MDSHRMHFCITMVLTCVVCSPIDIRHFHIIYSCEGAESDYLELGSARKNLCLIAAKR